MTFAAVLAVMLVSIAAVFQLALALGAPLGKVRVTGSGPPMHSREETKQSFAALIRAFPDLQVERRLLFGAGEWVAHEAEASGTHTGPLLRPDGSELPPTHRKARWGMSGFLRVKDGEVVEVHQYSDQLALLGQLGVIPAPPALFAAGVLVVRTPRHENESIT